MEEIKERRKIWNLISEFYLDTELDNQDYLYISKQLKKTGFSVKELKEIDLYEVFPILQFNLLSPAGEWAGFDEDWLYKSCYKNYVRKNRFYFRFFTKVGNTLFYWMRRRHWKGVEELLTSQKEISAISEFMVNDTFEITNRGIVLAGNIISGRISTGASIKIELDRTTLIREIKSIEAINSKKGNESSVGLIIAFKDKEEETKVKEWNPSGVIVEIN